MVCFDIPRLRVGKHSKPHSLHIATHVRESMSGGQESDSRRHPERSPRCHPGRSREAAESKDPAGKSTALAGSFDYAGFARSAQDDTGKRGALSGPSFRSPPLFVVRANTHLRRTAPSHHFFQVGILRVARMPSCMAKLKSSRHWLLNPSLDSISGLTASKSPMILSISCFMSRA